MFQSTISRLAAVATIVAVVLSLAGAALAAGSRPDDRAGLRGIGPARSAPFQFTTPFTTSAYGAPQAIATTGVPLP